MQVATNVTRERRIKCYVGEKSLLLFLFLSSYFFMKTIYLVFIKALRNVISFFVEIVLFASSDNFSESTESRFKNVFFILAHPPTYSSRQICQLNFSSIKLTSTNRWRWKAKSSSLKQVFL